MQLSGYVVTCLLGSFAMPTGTRSYVKNNVWPSALRTPNKGLVVVELVVTVVILVF
jgi:hypothetical protein